MFGPAHTGLALPLVSVVAARGRSALRLGSRESRAQGASLRTSTTTHRTSRYGTVRDADGVLEIALYKSGERGDRIRAQFLNGDVQKRLKITNY